MDNIAVNIATSVSVITAIIWLYKFFGFCRKHHIAMMKTSEEEYDNAREIILSSTNPEKRSDITLLLMMKHMDHSERRIKAIVIYNSIFIFIAGMSILQAFLFRFGIFTPEGVSFYILLISSVTVMLSLFVSFYFNYLLLRDEKKWKEGVYSELIGKVEKHLRNPA